MSINNTTNAPGQPRGWIGVDFDSTLAAYDHWRGATHCGDPVPDMLTRVQRWLDEGREVRIFTARIHPLDMLVPADLDMHMTEKEKVQARVGAEARGIDPERYMQAIGAVNAIRDWCVRHLGRPLAITNIKDYGMEELYDDRAVQVRPNTGELVGQSTRGLS